MTRKPGRAYGYYNGAWVEAVYETGTNSSRPLLKIAFSQITPEAKNARTENSNFFMGLIFKNISSINTAAGITGEYYKWLVLDMLSYVVTAIFLFYSAVQTRMGKFKFDKA
jgi:hypothetical protein